MIDPVQKQITVPTNAQRAFEIFTADIAKWWPLDSHSLSAGKGKVALGITVTPKLGGDIVEKMHDGSMAKWGVVTIWRPGAELEFTWHLSRGESEQTLVNITFTGVANGTLVKLVHSGWDALGEEAAAQRQQYNAGWVHVFEECYGAAATGGNPT